MMKKSSIKPKLRTRSKTLYGYFGKCDLCNKDIEGRPVVVVVITHKSLISGLKKYRYYHLMCHLEFRNAFRYE